ncbi:MAG: beta-mannanase [Armatimonadetes bacterium]|nr:beta-mannanase [Armatimonadota bacterium]
MNILLPLMSLLPLVAGCEPLPTVPTAPMIGAPAEVAALIRLTADKAILTGSTLQKTATGYTGAGYAGDFVPEGAKMVWTVPGAKPGIYEVRIRYKTIGGQKGYDLSVNGKKSSGMFAEAAAFTTIPGGKVELKTGENTVAIERGWGYFQIDSVELTPAKPAPPLKAVTAKLSDPRATPATQAMYDLLRRNYGKGTLSGQAQIPDSKYVQETIGETPAVQGGDFIEYSPTRLAKGSDPKNEVESMIAAAKAGQLITMLWHWNAPNGILDAPYTDKSGKKIDAHWYFGFYTTSTTFDLEKTLADPKSAEYALMLRDIDAIALQMKKFSDAGVPVLFRPLHEAEGGWFWWGAKGPEPCKKLWRLLYDRMTVKHNLHNLIWVYSSGTDPNWYPGDDVVDVIGIDQYPSDVSDPLSTVWETLLAQYGGRKMIALTEFGGVPDVASMERYGVRWSYFASWQGKDLGPRRYSVPELTRLYKAPKVMNLKGLPKLKK